MDMKQIGFFVACVFLFPVLVMQGSRGRLRVKGLFLEFGDSIVKDRELHECTEMMCDFEVLSSLSPEIKPAVFKCLIRNGFHIDVSEDYYRLENISSECLELILSSHHVPRRYLANQPKTESFDDRDQDQTPSSGRSRPSGRASSPPPARHSKVLPGPSPPKRKPKPPPPVIHEQQQDPTQTIIIAVALSSAGTSLILGCGFCCYRKCRRRTRYSRRDESPLLHLSLSEYSGSSNKSFGPGDSNQHMDKLGSLPLRNGSNQNGEDFSVDDKLDGTPIPDLLSGNSRTSDGPTLGLPPPPGRSTLPTVVPPSPIPVVPPTTIPVVPPPPAAVPCPPPPPPAPAPPPPPPPSRASAAAPPPPPPVKPPPVNKSSAPPPPGPPRPPQKPGAQPPPPGPPLPSRQPPGNSKTKRPSASADDNASKAKLKPFFWDKVQSSPNQSNVWSQIRSGSFQFDEEMIESLFGYNAVVKSNEGKKESSIKEPAVQLIQLLDPKKSQNLAISLKALGVKKQEVREALTEGNELPAALLQTLLKMQPTSDEELKLRLYTGDLSLLGPAEQFLKELVDIPFAYRRMDVLLFMSSLHEDVTSIKGTFATLEVACTELKNNRLFLKLLEAVLKTGNRMNDGTYRGGAQAFKLDTLLKLSDVKGADGKTTLLHFVVKQIIRSEGIRAARTARAARESGSMSSLTNFSFNSDDFCDDSLSESEDNFRELGLKVVSSISSELENVKKAAVLDADAMTSTVASFGRRLIEIKQFLNTDMKNLEEESGFHHSLKCFVEHAEAAITFLLEEEVRIRKLLQSTTDYFHGTTGKDEGLRLFIIVRDFLGILDKVCKEVTESAKKVTKPPKARESSTTTTPTPDPRQRLFPVIKDRRVESSSSDEDDP